MGTWSFFLLSLNSVHWFLMAFLGGKHIECRINGALYASDFGMICAKGI